MSSSGVVVLVVVLFVVLVVVFVVVLGKKQGLASAENSILAADA
jgi:hypothetical protein